jgi:hypothetical protein
MWPTLRETVARLDRFGSASEGHASAVYGPLVYRDDVARVGDQIRAALVAWVGVCVTTFRAPWPVNSIGGICALLAGQASNLRRHDRAAEWCAEMIDCRDRLMRVVDIQDRRALVGPCPDHTPDGEPCTGRVFAIYPADETLRPRMDCVPTDRQVGSCQKMWPPEQWTSTAARIDARQLQILAQQKPVELEPGEYSPDPTWLGGRGFISVTDASLIYGVSRSKLERWIRDGKLTSHRPVGVPAPRAGRPVLVVVDPVEVATRAAAMILDMSEANS